MTVFMAGIELREVTIRGQARLIPQQVGADQHHIEVADLLDDDNYCEHGVFRGPNDLLPCPWER